MLKKFILFFIFSLPFSLCAETFVAGKDYTVLSSVKAKEKNAQISEFFSYGCPWCYRIEAGLNTWLKTQKPGLKFNKVPVVFNQDWLYYAKAYYTIEALGMTKDLNPLLFKAVQEDKNSLNTNQAMIDFLVQNGVDKNSAESAFNQSTLVDMKVAEGNRLMGLYQVTAIPAVVVNQHYKTDLQMAKNEERFFQIINYLLNLKE